MNSICILPTETKGRCELCRFKELCDWENEQAEIDYHIYLQENEY